MEEIKSRFRVEGMDCASCALKVDKAARRVDGVREVSVSATAGTMVITHDEPTGLGVALVLALLPLGFISAIDARFRVAPVTAVIVLLSPVGHQASPIYFTLDRKTAEPVPTK